MLQGKHFLQNIISNPNFRDPISSKDEEGEHEDTLVSQQMTPAQIEEKTKAQKVERVTRFRVILPPDYVQKPLDFVGQN